MDRLEREFDLISKEIELIQSLFQELDEMWGDKEDKEEKEEKEEEEEKKK